MVKGLIYIKEMTDYPEPLFLSDDSSFQSFNQHGSGIMFKNFSLPMFLVSPTRNDSTMNGLLQVSFIDFEQ
jgi:hypothetical protein